VRVVMLMSGSVCTALLADDHELQCVFGSKRTCVRECLVCWPSYPASLTSTTLVFCMCVFWICTCVALKHVDTRAPALHDYVVKKCSAALYMGLKYTLCICCCCEHCLTRSASRSFVQAYLLMVCHDTQLHCLCLCTAYVMVVFVLTLQPNFPLSRSRREHCPCQPIV